MSFKLERLQKLMIFVVCTKSGMECTGKKMSTTTNSRNNSKKGGY